MKQQLINVADQGLDVIIDLRYATSNNFTNQKIYSDSTCLLHFEALEHLSIACELARKLGYKIKIFDAFRPVSAQKKLWNFLPNSEFISPPRRGSPHSRGVAIDLTLTKDNVELDMGTDFDEFSKLSYHGSKDISDLAYKNRLILLGIMISAGWDFFRNEWWHFQLFNSKSYPIIY